MLSMAERQEIDASRAQYPDARAAVTDALTVVQRRCGWVTDDALHDVAEHLDLPPAAVENVATFYSLIFRRPVGRHVILLCDSVSCWVMGYESLRDRLQTRLGITFGETTADDRFTLLPMCCLGNCDRAPALMIDDDLHDAVTPDGLDAILAGYDAAEDG